MQWLLSSALIGCAFYGMLILLILLIFFFFFTLLIINYFSFSYRWKCKILIENFLIQILLSGLASSAPVLYNNFFWCLCCTTIECLNECFANLHQKKSLFENKFSKLNKFFAKGGWMGRRG